ncbi:M20 metallopeptidase family protein [Halalkalibacterium ligniniphilum]|uniref:M20 metallopeptidase family protein n=1 Tax=Halalkalibacterium ligniniphilum TaxID=1134413 RepID=UPI00034B4836|nr:amidohydrolase [Halalkalibacterium ligniniphilum]
MLKERLLERLEELYPEMVSLRRYFHQNPELSFQEVHTPNTIADYLEELGIEVRRGVGGRGVVGTLHGTKPGKTVAIRADFDALPIQEETKCDYQSKVPGVMHACGHDGHTASLLVLAKALSEEREQLAGKIVFIHQHAEEVTPGGAIEMIADGCLDGVDVIFGTHLWSTSPYGEIGYRSGAIMAAADSFEINIQGKGGHGASPHETVDSIVVASSYVQSVQQIISRNIDPLKSAVISFGAFQSGGPFNVIADSAKLIGTVRTFEEEVQEDIIAKLERHAKGICDAAGASYSFDYRKGYPAVINHADETQLVKQQAINIIGKDNVREMEPVMGGEDFAYYLQEIPGAFFFTGAGNAEKGIVFPHHHPKFDIDERAMLLAAKILASVTLQYLEKGAVVTSS